MAKVTALECELKSRDLITNVNNGRIGEYSAETQMPQKRNLILVKNLDEANKKDSDEVKRLVTGALTSDVDRLRIRNMIKVRDGVLIETESEGDLNIIKNSQPLKDTGLQIKPPIQVKPKIIMFSTERDWTDEQILKDIYYKNLTGISKADFDRETKILFKTGPRDKTTVHRVFETSLAIRNVLMRRNHLYVSWRSLYFNDFVNVTRCFKCYGFGHMSKNCKRDSLCRHCGDTGHMGAACPNKDNPPKCVNCGDQHDAMSRNCVEYIRRREALMRRALSN